MEFYAGLLFHEFKQKLQQELQTKTLDKISKESKLTIEVLKRWEQGLHYPDIIEAIYVAKWLKTPIEKYTSKKFFEKKIK